VDEALGTPSEHDLAKCAGVRWPSGRRMEPLVEALPELLSSGRSRRTIRAETAAMKLF